MNRSLLLRKLILSTIIAAINISSFGSEKISDKDESEIASWIGKYPMSFFTKTRTAATAGKGKLSVSLKSQYYDWDQVLGSDNNYHDRTSGQEKERLVTTLCAKYGWAENHHIAIGIPYWMNDFDTSNPNDSQGLSNIYVFEKWRVLQETNKTPAVAVDFWYYFPNGDPDKSLGDDNSSYKITTEISKAWKDFSLHFNPGYTWSEDENAEIGEINGGLIWKAYDKLWPAIEYNYIDKEDKGISHDIVPGLMWKITKTSTFSIAMPINIDSTFTDRDEFGIMLKFIHKW